MNRKSNWARGTKTYIEKDGFEYDGVMLFGTINADVRVWSMPGTMYRRNGDPGDPPEYEEDITNWSVEDITTDPEDTVCTPEMIVAFEQYMIEKLNDVEVDYYDC